MPLFINSPLTRYLYKIIYEAYTSLINQDLWDYSIIFRRDIFDKLGHCRGMNN